MSSGRFHYGTSVWPWASPTFTPSPSCSSWPFSPFSLLQLRIQTRTLHQDSLMLRPTHPLRLLRSPVPRLMHTHHTHITHRPDIVTHLSPRTGLVEPTATLTPGSYRSLPVEMAPASSSVRTIFHITLCHGLRLTARSLGYVGYDPALETIIVVHQGTTVSAM